ncbi:hypothetical protein U4I65_08530 [Stenotrophomonas maltophilia]|uniref:hypothetical protein n=1 Tax=Stenotrophomonas maltophilia TaxID=40324 RepID=UPI002ACCD193|nr:hypothetical protein [Stenotrophomonas maltophilia]MDZ5815077.1 hypothetical protein [Stenotrophomonas maltophilia]
MSTQFTRDESPRRAGKRMGRKMVLAWALVAATAAVVVPLRLIEISQAHADRDAVKTRWAASSSVRG